MRRIDKIKHVVCSYFSISLDQMYGKSRRWHHVRPRMMAIHLIKKHTTISQVSLGFEFNKDASTIRSALKKIDKLIANDDEFKENIQDIEIMLPWISERAAVSSDQFE